MRAIRFLFIVSVFVSHALSAYSQESHAIDLRGLAAFRAGDDDVWRSKYIDEQDDWSFIATPGAWEDNGFPLLDGFAWYRVRFRIPPALRGDSLLLVMSGVDDADETFLNGVLVGKTGSFPPESRSELYSLRVYPLPRFIREEHNLLAVRVYDRGDQGGITGSMFRIIRVQDVPSMLDEIVDAPPTAHSLYISNGVMVSAISADSAMLRWCRPRPYKQISQDLPTEVVLSRMMLTDGDDGRPLGRPLSIGFVPHTGVVRAEYPEATEVFWYHPGETEQRVLVVAIRTSLASVRRPGIHFTFDRPAWMYSEQSVEHAGFAITYHLFVYNSCCDELAERDLGIVLARGEVLYGLETELARWEAMQEGAPPLSTVLSSAEQAVYRQSVITILQAIVREAGGGSGQILSGFEPFSQAVCDPADHLLAARALAAAGLGARVRGALDFVQKAEHEQYAFFDVFGTERGIGFPYLIPPVSWDGSGREWRWERADQAELRFDGMAWYIETVEALRVHEKNLAIAAGREFNDSAWIAPWWDGLSDRVADVLSYRLDSTGLLRCDDSPWGRGQTDLPSVHGAARVSHALDIAARYAVWMHDDLKRFLYSDASRRSREGVTALGSRVMGM